MNRKEPCGYIDLDDPIMSKGEVISLSWVIVTSLLALASFIWLFFTDWKMGLAMFLILWGNNVGRSWTQQKKRERDGV